MLLFHRILLLAAYFALICAKMDPYTGEEIDDYEYSYEGYEGYEYYSDEDGYESAVVIETESIPPGYLPPLKPTQVSITRLMLSKKFISVVGEQFGCLPQSEMTTSNIIDPKKSSSPNVKVDEAEPIVEEKDPNKKLNFREMQEEKVRIAREKMKLDAIILRHRLGSGCERMICGACRVIVEEFANRVVSHIDNSTVRYIRDLANFDFCHTRDILYKYRNIVNHVCVDQIINVSIFLFVCVLILNRSAMYTFLS